MPERPILIAYDGSEDAKGAITRAGELLTPGPALVVTSGTRPSAWSARPLEPPRTRPSSAKSTNWSATTLKSPPKRVPFSRARWASTASPLVARSDRNVWRVILDLGAERDARVIVLGSQGLGRVTDVLLGSVPTRVVHHADRPYWSFA